MIKVFTLSISMLVSQAPFCVKAQTIPIEWKGEGIRKSNNNDTITVYIMATINDGWHVYSFAEDEVEPPFITKILLEKSVDYQIVNKMEVYGEKEIYGEIFNKKIRLISGDALYKQKIFLMKKNIKTIYAMIECQVCSDSLGKCFFVEEKIAVPLNIQDKH